MNWILIPELTVRGASRLAKWLSFCLSVGFERDDLDRLDALWRQHHSRNGLLLDEPPSEDTAHG